MGIAFQGDQARPRVVKRGTEEFENLEEGIEKLIRVVTEIPQLNLFFHMTFVNFRLDMKIINHPKSLLKF